MAFSQRIPPVQNIATAFGFLVTMGMEVVGTGLVDLALVLVVMVDVRFFWGVVVGTDAFAIDSTL